MKKYEYINSGSIIKLQTLIQCGEVEDKNIIQVFDETGVFVTKGNWFQDNVLEYGQCKGIATKAGTGLTVNFKMATETSEAIELLLGGDGLADVLDNMAEQLKVEAVGAARLMNQQAKEGDVLRNHTNYGTMTQALRTLHHMGYDTMNATWGDGDLLICEKIDVNGITIYERKVEEVRA